MKFDLRILGAFALLALGTVLAFAPDAYLTMLARAFLFQWAIVFALLTILLIWRNQRIMGICAFAGMIMIVAQLDQPRMANEAGAVPAGLRVMHMNVFQPNALHEEIIGKALASNADIISLQEVSPSWAAALLDGLAAAYPYHMVEPRSNCYGIALFSRLPLEGMELVEMHGSPFIEARFNLNGDPVRLVTAHATSPTSYGNFRRRNSQLKDLAVRLNEETITTIVVGDMNAVNWDKAYRRFYQSTGLFVVTDTKSRTWPAIGPLALIPLDHVFISGDLSIARIERFNVPGSDHRGLMADIAFPGTY